MIATLRQRLRPLRPVLGPIWAGLRAIVGEGAPYSLPNLVERLRIRAESIGRAVLRRPIPPIRPLRHVELVDLAQAVPYYHARRVYLGAAGVVASDLIARGELRTALELGPHLRSLIIGADVMDIKSSPNLRAEGRRIVHDATKTPWPIADKAYDLFVAFQVFEHLGHHQAAAFREVRRVARNAILSLPIDWEMADPRNCHHRLSEEAVLDWFAPIAPTRILIGNPGHRKRLLFVFENLPSPDVDPA